MSLGVLRLTLTIRGWTTARRAACQIGDGVANFYVAFAQDGPVDPLTRG